MLWKPSFTLSKPARSGHRPTCRLQEHCAIGGPSDRAVGTAFHSRLTPTEAGLTYFEPAKRAIDEANDADDVARSVGAGLSCNLRVSAGVTLSRMHIIPHLGPFLEQHPGLNINVMLDDRRLNLVEEGIDVALRIGNLSDSNLTAQRIAQSPCRIFGTPTYFERFGESQGPADILNHQSVIYSLGEATH